MLNGLYNCSTARFDGSARCLTEDEMFHQAPSIFAREAHESRSTRFAPIPTIDILRQLQKEGFSPVAVRQSTCRDKSKAEFTKHLIRLRRLDDTEHKVGDVVPEAILKNANDGTSAYDFDLGLFRIRCLNSLVVKTKSLDSVKVRHSGDVASKVIEGTWTVISEAQKALAAPETWSQLPMTRDHKTAFAAAAHVLRFADAEGEVATPIVSDQLLHARRRDDMADDLWTTYNVVQENCIRGGLSAWTRDDTTRRGRRRVTTRGINGIDQDVKLNKALFVLAEKMAELMGVAA